MYVCICKMYRDYYFQTCVIKYYRQGILFHFYRVFLIGKRGYDILSNIY